MISYVSKLKLTKAGMGVPTIHPTSSGISVRMDLQIMTSDDGYPIMPSAPADGHQQTQKELAQILRRYLNAHYSELKSPEVIYI